MNCIHHGFSVFDPDDLFDVGNTLALVMQALTVLSATFSVRIVSLEHDLVVLVPLERGDCMTTIAAKVKNIARTVNLLLDRHCLQIMAGNCIG